MKTSRYLILGLVLLVAATPALATHWEAFQGSADCGGWCMTGTVVVGNLGITGHVDYTVTLMQGATTVEEHTGTLPFTAAGPAELDECGSWNGPLCGDYTVHGEFTIMDAADLSGDPVESFDAQFTCDCPPPPPEACWLTGGGARFSSITNSDLGESGRRHNWGGNVNPGCSPTAGDGGSWNHIDAVGKLHFHGTHIEVVDCGNVDGIPEGSTSPETPVNFIEFTGTGTLQGIRGNHVDYGIVSFFARAEDRNEPGSNGQHDGAGIDRYFLNVYTDPGDPAGSSVLLVDEDGDPATVDPLTITDGNMQMHISGCGRALPASGTRTVASPETTTSKTTDSKTWGAVKSMYR